ncbi:MAG: enolase C-terminal domain-like protein, partial [Boseongicola sp.]
AALPELSLGCEFYMSTFYAEADIATDPFPVRNGAVQIPNKPGLGVTPDPDSLANYRTGLHE